MQKSKIKKKKIKKWMQQTYAVKEWRENKNKKSISIRVVHIIAIKMWTGMESKNSSHSLKYKKEKRMI